MKRSYINRAGKKTLAWERTRAKLKKWFESEGITWCEARLPGCTVNNGLSFAHRKKRRFVTTQEELETVACLCLSCHQKIEVLAHEEMKAFIDLIIEGRS